MDEFWQNFCRIYSMGSNSWHISASLDKGLVTILYLDNNDLVLWEIYVSQGNEELKVNL